MRSFLLAFFFAGTAAFSAQAQDIILRTNGDEVKARVLTITPTELAYVPTTDPPSADTLYMPAPEVFMIRYANGTKEVLHQLVPPVAKPERTAQEMRAAGAADARSYFRAPGAFWGTAGATIVTLPLYGLGGVATGTAIAATPPKRDNLFVPDQALLNDPDYVSGYQKQAQRKKLGQAAAGFGVGLATSVVVIYTLIIIAFSGGGH